MKMEELGHPAVMPPLRPQGQLVTQEEISRVKDGPGAIPAPAIVVLVTAEVDGSEEAMMMAAMVVAGLEAAMRNGSTLFVSHRSHPVCELFSQQRPSAHESMQMKRHTVRQTQPRQCVAFLPQD